MTQTQTTRTVAPDSTTHQDLLNALAILRTARLAIVGQAPSCEWLWRMLMEASDRVDARLAEYYRGPRTGRKEMTATELRERIRKEHQALYPDGCHDLSNCGDCQARIVRGNQADKPVYEEDGSGAHVSWCPCYPCHVERTF